MKRVKTNSNNGPSFDIATSIINKLRKFNESLDETFLSEKCDPLIASRVLSTLVERGILDLSIDNKEVGGRRRKYSLKEQNNE